MVSFLSVIAAPAVRQVGEKGLFGKPYVRLGRLFLVIGSWVFQQGGALGYSLKGEPKLLGKLLGVDSEHAAEYVASLRKPVAAIISQAQTEEKTFFQLHTVRELRAYGVDLSVWPPSKALETKVSAEVASDVMREAFQKGAAFGCHFPEIFRQYWEYSYRVRPDSEWQEMRARGLILSEVQQARPLEVAIAELAEMALEWAIQEAPGLLDSREIQILNQLAVSAADAGQ